MPQFDAIPSTVPFLQADKFVNLIMGPVGSTKTTASLIKIAHEAKRVAPCPDGIRRSRIAVIRNTRQMLWDTTIPDFLKWYPDGEAGTLMRTESKFLIKLDDIECEVLFRGLDDANDVRRLLSLQLSFGMMDEFREINPDIFNALTGRLGRYPDKTMNGVGCAADDGKQIHKVWGASNPPDADTFWEQYITELPDNAHATIQPGGLDPEADWLHCLPDDYYDNLCEGKSEDWVDVYVHGKFGKSLQGQPVFRCFDKSVHVAKEALKPQSSTLVIGVDAGLNPTAVITQQTHDGRVLVLDTITGNEGGMGALRFIREKLKPMLVNKYRNAASQVIIDPAAFQRAQTDERSVADIFKAEGFAVKPAKTNSIAARLAAGEKYMTLTVNGNSGLLIDPEASGLLVTALRSKYRYKINTKGEKDDKPEKSHPWSDVCFVAGTPVLTPKGYVPIEALQLGDALCVEDGVDYVVATGSSNAHKLVRVELSDGTALTCTPDHPFILSNTCVLPADALQSAYELADKEHGKWASGQWRTRPSGRLLVCASSAIESSRLLLGAWLRAKVNIVQQLVTDWVAERLMVLSTMACGSPEQARIHISGINALTNALSHYTDMCGSSTTGQFQTGITYTISTVTHPTTTSVTLSASKVPSTVENTCVRESSPVPSMLQRLWSPLGKLLKRGMVLLKEESGTDSTQSKSPLTVKRVVFLSDGGRVYNLTTRRTHTYYAGPALVHNCDAFTYACLHHDGGGVFGGNVMSQRREIKPAPHRWAA